ncbi:hypothetical protein UFOVP247_140 [uncultured Caudovirales phage]|uniref:Uncharacterized protein n=1 Tax=uncultured Caudovirales phage TaxID=2100421 RepID=A0A6J7WTP8_9CAUD|nr:hypothetical protein UFOVP247_140 [uncultured Caudovirales phage]
MTTVADIFNSAFNKDAVSLKTAIDDAMSSRIADAVSDMTADVAASLFGATTGEETVENSEDQEISDTEEEQTDEHL